MPKKNDEILFRVNIGAALRTLDVRGPPGTLDNKYYQSFVIISSVSTKE
jgi:hypothetical protein